MNFLTTTIKPNTSAAINIAGANTEATIDLVKVANTIARTNKTYATNVGGFIRWTESRGFVVTADNLVTTIKAYLEYCRETYRPSTVALKRQSLRSAFKSSTDSTIERLAIDDVFKSIKAPKPSKAITKNKTLDRAQVYKLIDYIANRRTKGTKDKEGKIIKQGTLLPTNKRLIAIISLLASTGLRISEAINIKNKDCTELLGRVTIRVLGKGSKEREVSISSDLYYKIKAAHGCNNGYLLCTTTGKQYNYINLTKEITKAGANIGVKISAHTLRHSFATNAVIDANNNAGGSIKAISKYLGHSTTAITEDLYVHAELEAPTLDALEIVPKSL